ncbi:MAG: hypothetical protein IJL97_05125 [Lachnospiraceae bacterium]|nr:hypothetical protein [Lachnospiraceae bacterium]
MKLLNTIIQFTWGLPQNLLGLALYLKYKNRPHHRFRDAVVTEWDREGSMSLGTFIFLEKGSMPERHFKPDRITRDLLTHEYGHTVQSLMLGPLYLPVIGVPSFIWCNVPLFQKLRSSKNISYYKAYPEAWADRLGGRTTGRKIVRK